MIKYGVICTLIPDITELYWQDASDMMNTAELIYSQETFSMEIILTMFAISIQSGSGLKHP